MGSTFNKDFKTALANKLALQTSQAGQYDATARLRGVEADVLPASTRSAINLEGAQAGLATERTGLLGREVESTANYRDQLARSSRIGANVDLGTFLAEEDADKFAGSRRNLEQGGAGGVSAFSPPSSNLYGGTLNSSGVRGQYGAPFDPSRGSGVEDPMATLRKGSDRTVRERIGFADGGLIESPGVLSFANGGIVEGGGVDPLTADYELYRTAATKAGVPVLSMREAIPRMAQIRANKRSGVLDMIAKGGTTPQGYAEGGEIDGPGTGKSDSIPAVVDGVGPAAVSDGEFHIPKHVVDYFGTKMFDGLVEKARMAGKATQRKQGAGYADGGPVKKSQGSSAMLASG